MSFEKLFAIFVVKTHSHFNSQQVLVRHTFGFMQLLITTFLGLKYMERNSGSNRSERAVGETATPSSLSVSSPSQTNFSK